MTRFITVLTVLMLLAGADRLAARTNPADPAAFVAALRAPVSVLRNGHPLPVRIGMQIVQGDILRCGPRGRLKVLFTDDAVLSLGSNSEVEVARHLFDPAKNIRISRVGLLNGTLRILVQKLVAGKPADFSVHTSNAVAGVRGTEFVLVAHKEQTRLYTLSGEVDLQSGEHASVRVAAGMGSQVGSDGLASEAVAVAGELLTSLRAETDTEQNPTALAWSARVAPGDRPGAPGPGAGAGELDLESGGSDSAGRLPTDLELDPCSDCGNDWSPIGGDRASGYNSFTADSAAEQGLDYAGEIPGLWKNPEHNLDIDPATIHPITLRIRIHR